jgi:hypothetical protein
MIPQLMRRQGTYDLSAENIASAVACTTCTNCILDFTSDPQAREYVAYCASYVSTLDGKPTLCSVARTDELLCGSQALSYVRGGGLVRVEPERDMGFAL